LVNISEITTPPKQDEDHFDTYQNYVLRVQKRDELAEYLKEQGDETLIKDRVANHKHPKLGLSDYSLPITEQLADEVISLPLYVELDDEGVQYVIEQVRKFYAKE